MSALSMHPELLNWVKLRNWLILYLPSYSSLAHTQHQSSKVGIIMGRDDKRLHHALCGLPPGARQIRLHPQHDDRYTRSVPIARCCSPKRTRNLGFDCNRLAQKLMQCTSERGGYPGKASFMNHTLLTPLSLHPLTTAFTFKDVARWPIY
eukprot:1369223-Amphidinium_carterae.1